MKKDNLKHRRRRSRFKAKNPERLKVSTNTNKIPNTKHKLFFIYLFAFFKSFTSLTSKSVHNFEKIYFRGTFVKVRTNLFRKKHTVCFTNLGKLNLLMVVRSWAAANFWNCPSCLKICCSLQKNSEKWLKNNNLATLF